MILYLQTVQPGWNAAWSGLIVCQITRLGFPFIKCLKVLTGLAHLMIQKLIKLYHEKKKASIHDQELPQLQPTDQPTETHSKHIYISFLGKMIDTQNHTKK